MNDGRIRARGAYGRTRQVLFGAAFAVLVLYGCSSSEEARRAVALGGACSINTDCNPEHICVFARCHIPCREDRDCEPGLRCVHGDVEGETACQLPEHARCAVDKDCPGEQVCGIDDACRDACSRDMDCVGTQFCANSGECASSHPEHDSVDADGNIIVDGPGGAGGSGGSSGGRAGASGKGGQAGSAQSSGGGSGEASGGESGQGGEPGAGRGGSTANGGGSATSGEAGEGGLGGDGGSTSTAGGTAGGANGGTAGAGAGGAAGGGAVSGAGAGGASGSSAGGDGGTSGAAGGGGTGEDLTETPDGVELVPNGTREESVPLTTGATIFLSGSDHDWFVVTPPQDGKSHVLTLRVEQDPNLAAQIDVRSAEDHSQIELFRFDLGVTSFAYVTTGPNAVLHLDFARYPISGTEGTARITLEIVPENDAYEPNDDADTPASISLGETVHGQLLNPAVNATDQYLEDWFSVELTQGTATLTILAAPEEPRIRVRRMSATNQVSNIVHTNAGEIPVTQFSVPAAGTYRFGFEPYPPIPSAVAGAKPTYLSEQYSFTITQP